MRMHCLYTSHMKTFCILDTCTIRSAQLNKLHLIPPFACLFGSVRAADFDTLPISSTAVSCNLHLHLCQFFVLYCNSFIKFCSPASCMTTVTTMTMGSDDKPAFCTSVHDVPACFSELIVHNSSLILFLKGRQVSRVPQLLCGKEVAVTPAWKGVYAAVLLL